MRDDVSEVGIIVYWILFFLFTGLTCLGLLNAKTAQAIGRLKSHSILTFYISSLLLLALRVLLFADVFLHWPLDFYLIGLITLPTFLYLVTGLALTMCNFELVIKFRIHGINENNRLTSMQKQKKVLQSANALLTMHITVWILIVVIFVAFVTWIVVCSVNECTFQDTAALTLQIGILNLVVMLLFAVSTVALVRQWRSRFGADF